MPGDRRCSRTQCSSRFALSRERSMTSLVSPRLSAGHFGGTFARSSRRTLRSLVAAGDGLDALPCGDVGLTSRDELSALPRPDAFPLLLGGRGCTSRAARARGMWTRVHARVRAGAFLEQAGRGQTAK